MVIPYSYNTPEDVLTKCSNGEITPEDAISALEAWRDYYRWIIGGQAAASNYPVTLEEAEERIGPFENAIETLQAILHPPVLSIDLTEIRHKLREIRDKCITGGCTKKAALALFDQVWLDFVNDTILKAGMDSLPRVRQAIYECKDMDIINGIRAEIEGVQEPSPDTKAPERKKTDTIKQILQWLRGKQYAIHHTEEAQPVSMNNNGIEFTPEKKEWRITKTVAFIYRELVSAAIKKEIPLAESEVPDFIVNYLKNKDGSEITKNATDKAAKVRQNQPKSA
jgi:hypothetical protein